MTAKRLHDEAFEMRPQQPHPFSPRPEHRPIRRARGQHGIVSRFHLLRRQLSGQTYYDPYQREQVQQEKSEEEEEERPQKRHRSVASAIVNSVVQGFLYGSAVALTAYEFLWAEKLRMKSIEDRGDHAARMRRTGSSPKMRGRGVDFSYFQRSPALDFRMQQAEQTIRRICLQSQQANFHRKFELPLDLYRPPAPPSEDPWGLIDKHDYNVRFLMTTSHGSGTQAPVLTKSFLGSRQLILNRPRRLNAVNLDMVKIIWPNMKAWEESDQVNVILLKGEGRALCAGGDVKYVVELCKRHDPELIQLLDSEYQLFHFIGTMNTPYVAVMDGITMGAGSGLSVHAPFRIATEKTRFAMPENAIGLFPDVGASFFLSRLDGQLGTYLGMTGITINSEDVLYAGIASHFVSSSQLPALEERLAELGSPDHDAVHAILTEFSANVKRNPHYTLHGDTRKTIDRCFVHDTAEDIVAALKDDGSKFALDTRDIILSRSPTSVKLTLHNLRTAAHMDFAECLRHEHALWQKVAVHHDFIEGVTAHVVKKTQPRWKPASLEAIADADLKATYYSTGDSKGKPLQLLSEKNYHLHPYRHFALPSEKDIQNMLSQSNNKMTHQDIIDFFMAMYKNRFGVYEKIVDVLKRKTRTTADGTVEWV
ncbi:hypothetical protein EC973_003192 [Apophysomyces ossiformis]|uniref:3-hydroxyisobutyryl-CoA hydrolase n=1 Tax=Apophysomyces ossiformis TaxID=679940 RepID=A0A8H7BLY0_9FUNG|nr:hypothetical protein EC973_003192 [Apophysomyces ossiformis]